MNQAEKSKHKNWTKKHSHSKCAFSGHSIWGVSVQSISDKQFLNPTIECMPIVDNKKPTWDNLEMEAGEYTTKTLVFNDAQLLEF